jgi:hypothetical protein
MSVARLRLAPVGETMFPPRALFFFRVRRDPRGAQVAARAAERERRNLPVSSVAPSPTHDAEAAS